MPAIDGTSLAAAVVAIGALGTAAFGVVDILKVTPYGLKGYGILFKTLGENFKAALKSAYGEDYQQLLKAQYRDGRGKGELPKSLRRGIKIGLPACDVTRLSSEFPGLHEEKLQKAIACMQSAEMPDDDTKRELARLEMALDARIDAALALAEVQYKGYSRAAAAVISIVIAVAVAAFIDVEIPHKYLLATIIGIAAVPIAPVAKDLSKAITSSNKAIRSFK